MKLSFLVYSSLGPLVIRFHQRDPNLSAGSSPPLLPYSFFGFGPGLFKECLPGTRELSFLSLLQRVAAPVNVVMYPCVDTCEQTSALGPEQRTDTEDSGSVSVYRNADIGHHRKADLAWISENRPPRYCPISHAVACERPLCSYLCRRNRISNSESAKPCSASSLTKRCRHTVLFHREHWLYIVGNRRPLECRDARVSPCAERNAFCRRTSSHSLDACNGNVSGALCSRSAGTYSLRWIWTWNGN